MNSNLISKTNVLDKIEITVEQIYHDYLVKAPGLIYLCGHVFIDLDKTYYKAWPTLDQALKDYSKIISDLVNNWQVFN